MLWQDYIPFSQSQFEDWQFNIMTAPILIQCHVKTNHHEKSTRRWIHQSQPWRGSCLVDIVSSSFLCNYPYIPFCLPLVPPLPLSLSLSLLQLASSSAPCMPKTLVSRPRLSESSRRCDASCTEGKNRRFVMEGREKSHEEEERRAMELDEMVKRAEDGRCLVVCRIWVSDLGLRPAVGRLIRQETCFLGRLSLLFPSRSPLCPCALFSVPLTLFLPMSRLAAACYVSFLALSRTENVANRARARFSRHCPFKRRSLKFPAGKVFREVDRNKEREREKKRKGSPHR